MDWPVECQHPSSKYDRECSQTQCDLLSQLPALLCLQRLAKVERLTGGLIHWRCPSSFRHMISDNSRKSGSFVNCTYQLLANVPTQSGHIAAFHHCWECRVIGRRHLGQHCKQPRPGGPRRTGPTCREGTWRHRRSMQEGHDGSGRPVLAPWLA